MPDDLPTCEDCGLQYLHTVSGGPGQTRRSCGCSTTPDLVTDGGENKPLNTACGKRSCNNDYEVTIRVGTAGTGARCGLHALEDAVDGVGPAKAEQLIEEFGSLNEICYAAKHQTVLIARLDGWSPSSAGELETKLKEAGVWLGPEEEVATDGGQCQWDVSEPVDHSDLLPLDMANNIDDDRVRERITWVDGFGRAYADTLGVAKEAELVTDGGIPDSLEELAATCESCGSDVEPRYLEDGECPGCVYGEPIADGGLHTVEHNGTTFAVCHMVAYDDHADLDIDYSGEEPVVTNHDDVPKHDEVRLLTLNSIREHGMEHMAIGPSHSMWREEFADLEPGDSIDLDEEEPVADGGTAWTDLTGFKRDCLEAIRRLDEDGETTYGLAIKRELERVYGEEVNHGRLYPNLDDLVDYGLVEKRELDKRTNEYQLTDAAQAMLEQRARLLADACGMQQPVADGGEN